MPIAAAWLAAAEPGVPALRQALVAALVLAWAVRLTANCLVRWHSLEHEDFDLQGRERLCRLCGCPHKRHYAELRNMRSASSRGRGAR